MCVKYKAVIFFLLIPHSCESKTSLGLDEKVLCSLWRKIVPLNINDGPTLGPSFRLQPSVDESLMMLWKEQSEVDCQ